MSVVLWYYRYHNLHAEHVSSFEYAVERAYWEAEYGTSALWGIETTEDGFLPRDDDRIVSTMELYDEAVTQARKEREAMAPPTPFWLFMKSPKGDENGFIDAYVSREAAEEGIKEMFPDFDRDRFLIKQTKGSS